MSAPFVDPDDVVRRLDAVDHLLDEGTATALYLAATLGQPLLLEGEPGVGKTAAAKAMADGARRAAHPAAVLRGPRRQRGALRVELPAPAAGHPAGRGAGAVAGRRRPVHRGVPPRAADPGRASATRGPTAPVLLIDEIDRADAEFEALLFEFLGEGSVTIPELGTLTAVHPPVVVLTSNRSRELHDALKRRCLYHWIDFPERGPGRRDRPPVGAGGQRRARVGRHRLRRCGCASSTSTRRPAWPRPSTGCRPSRRWASPSSSATTSSARSAPW